VVDNNEKKSEKNKVILFFYMQLVSNYCVTFPHRAVCDVAMLHSIILHTVSIQYINCGD